MGRNDEHVPFHVTNRTSASPRPRWYAGSLLRRMPLSERQKEAVSGLAAGFASTVITQPLDLVKVRMQLSKQHSSRPFALVMRVLSQISTNARNEWSSHGKSKPLARYVVAQYYRGIGPNLMGNVSAWGLYFTLYAETKRYFTVGDGSVYYFAASATAGAMASVLTNPIWVLKTRILSTLRSEANSYRSVWDGILQIVHKEGIRTFWSGTIPSLFHVLQAGIQFTLYDHAKNYFAREGELQLTFLHYLVASVMSKSVSTALLYPSQVIRSQIQSYNFTHERRSVWMVTRRIYLQERLGGFYKGISANIVRVLPATCITFLTYETTKQWLGS